MTHEILREKVIDLALGALDAREARQVEAHAAGCAECAAELASLRGTRSAMAALPPLPAPERGEAVLLAAARQAAEASGSRQAGRFPGWGWAAVFGAASATAAVLVSLRLAGDPPGARPDEALLGRAPAAATLETPRSAPQGGAPALAGRLDEAAPAATIVPAAPPPAPPRPARTMAVEQAPALVPPPGGGARGEIGIGNAALADAAAPASAPTSAQATAQATAPALEPAPADRLAAAPARRSKAVATSAEAELAKEEAAAPSVRAGAAAFEAKSKGAPTTFGLAAPAPAGTEVTAAKAAKRDERAPAACPGEQTRTLRRDAEGRVVARERTGRLGGVDYRAEERYGPDGRLTAATLLRGGRLVELDEAALRATGLEPFPGLRLAPTAAVAEAAPPACGP